MDDYSLLSTGGYQSLGRRYWHSLFVLGSTIGYSFSEVWAVAFACWLKELKGYSTVFISRANALYNVGVQLQTLALDAIQEASTIDKSTKNFILAGVLFGTLIVLIMLCVYLYESRPKLINLTHFE